MKYSEPNTRYLRPENTVIQNFPFRSTKFARSDPAAAGELVMESMHQSCGDSEGEPRQALSVNLLYALVLPTEGTHYVATARH